MARAERMGLSHEWKPFAALAPGEVYDILRLRAEVFVVEQACAFCDPDGMDPSAWHLLTRDSENRLLGTARIFLPATAAPDAAPQSANLQAGCASIGRIVTAPSHRGQGLGRQIVLEALSFLREQCGTVTVLIGAQARLRRLYSELGFEPSGGIYLEDGITHLPMRQKI